MSKILFGLLLLVSFHIQALPLNFINSEDFLKHKRISRELLKQKFSQDKSIILAQDQAEDLIDDPEKLETNLQKLEDEKLMSAKLPVMPWSDSYWPIYAGATAFRYNDPNMSFDNWLDYKKYYDENPTAKLVAANKIDELSPAEKYDYIFGLKSLGLTLYSWQEGESYQRQFNKVESWMGLCHGWAAASIVLPEPKKNLEIKNIFGKNLILHPSDIKALGTLLYANGNIPSKYIGTRCELKNPERDGNGRVKLEDCLDNNPGTWHLVVTHQIGKIQRSFVMDATYDYEVWNQPVYSYKYQYVHLESKEKFSTLAEAILSVEDFKNDERKSYRSDNAKYIVGVEMKVKYVAETEANIDEEQESLYSEVTYRYDLELDADKNIIGGEWYSKAHPDFLWIPKKGHVPATFGDSQYQSLNLNAIPKLLAPMAKQNASMGMPLSSLIKTLFKSDEN